MLNWTDRHAERQVVSGTNPDRRCVVHASITLLLGVVLFVERDEKSYPPLMSQVNEEEEEER